MKQFGNPHISEQLFDDPPLCGNFQNKNPPPPLILGGEEAMFSLSATAREDDRS